MKKAFKRVFICFCISILFWSGFLLADRAQLNRELIRLHVIANSDTPEDQAMKLRVRDAVLSSIREDLASIQNVDAAKSYLQENLPKLERIANEALQSSGSGLEAVVSFCKQAFPTRNYDTFHLPAGVYETLKITIGEGSGKNWWCVAFPSLCLPATTEGFEAAAASAGFSEKLTDTLTYGEDNVLRFYLLDLMGQLKNRFFQE